MWQSFPLITGRHGRFSYLHGFCFCIVLVCCASCFRVQANNKHRVEDVGRSNKASRIVTLCSSCNIDFTFFLLSFIFFLPRGSSYDATFCSNVHSVIDSRGSYSTHVLRLNITHRLCIPSLGSRSIAWVFTLTHMSVVPNMLFIFM